MAVAAPVDPPSAAPAAVVDPPLADGEIEQVGPGVYSTSDKTFEVYETDVAEGVMGRSHTVAAQAGGVSKPESAPASRADMGAFGPGWQAEFLGGQLNRQLKQNADSVVVTDLNEGVALTYALKSSIDYPNGGGVKKYASSQGDTLTETTRFDEASGTMVSTALEAINAATSVPDADLSGDADAGTSLELSELTPTYTWKQVASGTDKWRVTDVGTDTDSGLSSVVYDTKGRISTIEDTEIGETTSQRLSVKYSTATTATSTAPGEFTGRAREITLTDGATTQTLARYSYDTSGLLRSVANPAEGSEVVSSYSYDSTGRVSDLVSPTDGAWDLAFPAGSASPVVDPVGAPSPGLDAPLEGAAGIGTSATAPPASDFVSGEITDPQAYPRHCDRATDWLYYREAGCSAWVAHYGWHQPWFMHTKTGKRVVGINYDHCSTPGPNISRPGGFDFRVPCDMHDYGYGLIGNAYKGYVYYLDKHKKSNVDKAFYTTMNKHTCQKYNIFTRPMCSSFAWTYYKAVSNKKWGGQPKNGANATK
ncbi:phospholipase A2 [Streptomyces sp. NPDC088923]|uniref:phospholipase A2 n=1 Tax=Streptomyces sp. NPDC088923 TaxID=3365913 RepID=UPI0038095254